MASTMYRVGDYVYFESTARNPYQIRRIEELYKAADGSVEARAVCYFRRRDLPSALVTVADKHQVALENDGDNSEGRKDLSTIQNYQLKHRELFLSRQVETLSTCYIRGKCCVTLLNEAESFLSYLNKEDTFFYCLVYDPSEKTLLSDKGDIRVGSKFQADMPPFVKELSPSDPSLSKSYESLIWTPEHDLTDRQINQYIDTARTLGTYARALDCNVDQTGLVMNAAAASRDITIFNAMNTLHKNDYDIAKAVFALIPAQGPVLCRDELEVWSAREANLFEEAMEKYGKDFNDIRQDFLPWKSLKSIIEYYYMWKTTDRYVKQKRLKAIEAENKLTQVTIQNKSSKGLNYSSDATSGKPCESCKSLESSQWYSWGPSHLQCKLCQGCWNYWKKYGGLKIPSKALEDDNEDDDDTKESENMSFQEHLPDKITLCKPHKCCVTGCNKEFKAKILLTRHYAVEHDLLRAGFPGPMMKVARGTFFLKTTSLTKLARRLCNDLFKPKHAARSPFSLINSHAIKQQCQLLLAGKSQLEMKALLQYDKKAKQMVSISAAKIAASKISEPSPNRDETMVDLTSSPCSSGGME